MVKKQTLQSIMKRVFYVETLYQLIIVMLIKERITTDGENDIVITNFREGIKDIAERIKSLKCFDNVYLIEEFNEYMNQNTIADIKDVAFLNTKAYAKRVLKRYICEEFVENRYDEIWFYNYGALSYCIIQHNYHEGIKLNRFEEGLLAYNHEQKYGKRTILADKIRTIIKGSSYLDKGVDFYCTYPELVKNPRFSRPHKVENIKQSDIDLINNLRIIFGASKFDTKGKKYLYFATGSDVCGQVINEDTVVDEIANIVGKENILVKLHPLDKRNLYQEKGYCVCEATDVPWEIIWITTHFEDITLLTCSSGCVLNSKVLYEGIGKAIYLYPMIYGRNKVVDEFCDISIKPLIEHFNTGRKTPLIDVAKDDKELAIKLR